MSTPTPAASENPKILVLGVGNLLMQDEGIGVHVARVLSERYAFDPEVDIVDGGTAGLELIDKIDEREQVLIVDAVDFDLKPGSMIKLQNDEINAQLQDKMSLHHLGLTDVLSAAKLLDIQPREICLIGIQPHAMEVEVGLSPVITARFEEVLDGVVRQLVQWGVWVTRNHDELQEAIG